MIGVADGVASYGCSLSNGRLGTNACFGHQYVFWAPTHVIMELCVEMLWLVCMAWWPALCDRIWSTHQDGCRFP